MPTKQVTIEGQVASRVHDQVLAYAGEGPLNNVLLQFPADGLDTELAERYPFKKQGESASDAIREIVGWWQHPTVPGGPARRFNHGSRLRGRDEDWSQLSKIVDELQEDPTTTKGHATLQSHRPGYAATHGHPSMCDIFFALRPEGGDLYLDITATFRKLELRYWWIVNVHELSSLQVTVVDALAGGKRPVLAKPGIVATFAFRGVFASTEEEPQVAIHALDRAHLFRPDDIRDLAASLANKQRHQGSVFYRWRDNLKDLIPSPRMNRDGFPVCVDGLIALSSCVRLLSQASVGEQLGELADTLDNILRENRLMVEALDVGGPNEAVEFMYRGWRDRCSTLVKKVEHQVAGQIRMPELAE